LSQQREERGLEANLFELLHLLRTEMAVSNLVHFQLFFLLKKAFAVWNTLQEPAPLK
jgi:hypothetical protein